MTKFESSIKQIPYPQECVYEKLSNLSNLDKVKERLPQGQVDDISFDADTISFSVPPAGKITLKVIERDPCKCIKFATVESALPFNLWIQLLPTGEQSCKIKITLGMDVNPFLKTMLQKPLQNGLEKMVTMLSLIEYQK